MRPYDNLCRLAAVVDLSTGRGAGDGGDEVRRVAASPAGRESVSPVFGRDHPGY